jgi:paraquat-inducible protein B
MKSKATIVGAFILGALGLGVLAILFFGGTHLFASRSQVVVFFSESVAGLDVGAPVTFHGARIGSVQSIAIHFSPDTMTARIPVVLEIDPSRITWEGRFGGQNANADYRRLVQAGLRAQLALESLITGKLDVDLYFRPGTAAQLVGRAENLPEIPAVPSDLDRLRAELTNLPLKELAETAQKALASVQRLSDHLDARLDPLASSAQNTLDTATNTLQTAEETIHRVQAEASVALHHLDSLLVDAHHQLDDRSGELSRTLVASSRAVHQAEMLLGKLNDVADPRSRFRSDLEAAARDLSATTSALRDFAETIEHNPNALLLGRANR